MDLLKSNQKRHEIKFLINSKEKYELIEKKKLKKLFPDRIVESIYFDTKDFQFFNLSEEGVTPRFKIRLRGYNNQKLNNLEIKTTNNYHREKVTIKNFLFDNYELHKNLKKIGIQKIVHKKIRVKYLRSYYKLENVGRITLDRDIEFLSPEENFHNSKKIKQNILEVKVQKENIDKNYIEKIINLKETRFSKYCIGINCLRETN
tara:strand:+ start:911 stop:1522 length:612 start_codon:yes stop_codon:yes gene_type:complete